MEIGGKDGIPMSEINVTPLVDVMLVLLIIFMVTAPRLEQGVKVDLPQVTAAALPQVSEELVISVTRDRRVYLNRYAVPLSELEPKLEQILARRANKDVYLRADKDVAYGFVVQVMAEVKKAGIVSLGMVTEPERVQP
ncbi:MAG: protein TolR [Deltaproteobacteria bacterium RBG_13_61_14]|nr:MAG: protein TolR [Deltaproteobacteria bacterium RBG_13_61_14]